MLKSLELFGFKSFADRTTFDFAAGITCVVGPNGSGKSNVVDALKWILGDQSAKSLRGKEMTEVIFNGSAGRKPSPFAEATLTFDNSQGLLPIAAAEVQIGRRLYAGGDSEYLLNKASVRLKDIREMFMGTGAGTAAYSIIEQGRVDQILQANPTARRLVFEEAAGISRYKARKIEAQRRLERVDQNLLRLRDIVDELESRLNATRSQASKAARYRELSGELRSLWTGLAADDYRRAQAELAHAAAHADSLQQQLTAVDQQLESLAAQLGELEGTAAELEHTRRQIDRRRGAEREEIARHESAIRHHGTQYTELEQEIERLRRQRNTLRNQCQSVSTNLEDSTHRLARLETEFADQQQSLETRAREMKELRERVQAAAQNIERQEAERDGRLQERARLERDYAGLESREEAEIAREQEAEERCRSLDVVLGECRAELVLRKQALREAEQNVADAQRRIEAARDERRLLRGAHSEADGRLARWREERGAKFARRQLLEDLEARQEGLNAGVRTLLRRAAESKAAPWNLILGHVGDLLQADLDDAPLLEVALGARLQLLVIEQLTPLVAYLNRETEEIGGRVGFVEFPRAEQQRLAASTKPNRNSRAPLDLHGQPGVICRADRLVSQSLVPGLAAHLLADTWIVETLDVAIRLAHGEGRGCRFATRQGELVDAGGTLYVGHAANEITVIFRKSELRRLRVELQELDRRIAVEQHRLEVIDESLLASDGDLQALQAELNQQMELLAVRKSEHAAQAAECGRVQADIDAALALQRLAQQQRDQLSVARCKLQTTLAELEDDIGAITGRIDNDQEIVESIQHELQQLHREINAEQLQLAKYEERLAGLRAAQVRLTEEQHERRRQSEQADAYLVAAQSKLREIARALLAARSFLAVRYLADVRWVDEARGVQQQLDSCRAARKTLQREQDALREDRRQANDAIHSEEMRSRDLRHQITTLEERIREEFQLELAELVAAGVTAAFTQSHEGPTSMRLVDHEDAAARDDGALTASPDLERVPESASAQPLDPSEQTLSADDALPAYDAQTREELEARVERLRRKIKALGSINAESLQDLDDLEARYGELAGQLDDLEQAKSVLEEIIRRINAESKRLFLETFEAIRKHFQELYRKLFGGGEGNIILEDPDDVLECGIDIVARPPGKELRSISLLSGGEKTMTAVGLLFAMFKSKPSPYCILDEVDAALDDANVDRYVNVVKEFRESTQFVIITHRKRTMTAADRLYGVTMEQAGVSKRLTVQFEDVSEDGHLRIENAAA
ncbi:MAG: chromosome segregation protein SMC [Planctomycetaceae bacterium]|nr:chromosome segregation protein SMC [Planctomycetaceae bacterium]